jgi:flagellar hook protein FlgE
VGNGYFSNGGANENFADLIDNPVPASGTNGKIKQFALELSNVDLTNEFAMMISHQRSFQAGSRVVTTSDAILNEAVNLKR